MSRYTIGDYPGAPIGGGAHVQLLRITEWDFATPPLKGLQVVIFNILRILEE